MRTLAGGFIALVATFAHTGAFAADLPSFNVDLAQTSVSGLSSGAFMAGQFHVAFSETVMGAGIVAGGPYGCAEGQLATALNRCMQTHSGAARSGASAAACRGVRATRARSIRSRALRAIASTSSRAPTTLPSTPAVVDATVAFYPAPRRHRRPTSPYVDDLAAGHVFLTESHGSACPAHREPLHQRLRLRPGGRAARGAPPRRAESAFRRAFRHA